MKTLLFISNFLFFSISINAQDLSIKQTEQFYGFKNFEENYLIISSYMNIIDSSKIHIILNLSENWTSFDSISTYLELDSTSFNDNYFLYDRQLKDSIPCLVFRNSEGFAFYISKRKAISTYITDEKIYYHPQWAQVFVPPNRKNKYSSLPVMFNK